MSILRNKVGIKGSVTLEVFGPDGELKRFPQTRLQRLLRVKGKPMRVVNHNIVTDEGDACIVDMLVTTATQTAFDNTNAKIEVGTGYTGASNKAEEGCNTSVAVEAMDATYPKQKGAFGAANDNVIQYKATFEAGDLNVTGIDEVAILNNATPASADCLAYAEVSPNLNVTTADTLAVTWEITFLGA